MFVNRYDELKALESTYASKKSEFVIIYGRRRIGKTMLIKKFLEGKKYIYFLAEYENLALEFERFKDRIGKSLNIHLESTTWERLFEELSNIIKDRLAVVVDEFPYWVMQDASILSKFQYICDEVLPNKNIVLILLGSYVNIIEKQVLGQTSPLFGRRTVQIELNHLKTKDLKKFFPNYTLEQIIYTYGAVDSIPYYLVQFDQKLNFENNVKNTFLNKFNPLYNDAEIILSSELREYNTYMNILKAIIDGASKLNEIATKAKVDVTNISKYLNVLIGMKIIKKLRPVTFSVKEKNYIYELQDNYFRFWLTYVYPYREDIELNGERHLEYIMKDYSRYLGHIFELFIQDNLNELINFNISESGKWWYKENEIDIVAIDKKGYNILFSECKWQKEVDGKEMFNELKKKAENVKWNNQNRIDSFAIFARSFQKRADNCLCYDLEDLSRKLGFLKKR